MFRVIALSLIIIFSLSNIAAAAHTHDSVTGKQNAPVSASSDSHDQDNENNSASHCQIHCWHHHMASFTPDAALKSPASISTEFVLSSHVRPEAPVFSSKKPPRL